MENTFNLTRKRYKAHKTEDVDQFAFTFGGRD